MQTQELSAEARPVNMFPNTNTPWKKLKRQELTDRHMEKRSHFRNFAFPVRKKEFSAWFYYEEANQLWEFQTQRVVAFTWWGIKIDSTTKSLWKKDNALHIEEPERKNQKLSTDIATDNSSIWMMLWAENGQNRRPDMSDIAIRQYSLSSPFHYPDTIKMRKWDLLPHPPYSPDIVPSDFHLLRLMAHGLAALHLINFEEVQNWKE